MVDKRIISKEDMEKIVFLAGVASGLASGNSEAFLLPDKFIKDRQEMYDKYGLEQVQDIIKERYVKL